MNSLKAFLSPILIAATAAAALADPADKPGRNPNASKYSYFQSFGEPKTPLGSNSDPDKVRKQSDEHFNTVLDTCVGKGSSLAGPNCNPNQVYEFAKAYCSALEFADAVAWRVTSQTAGTHSIKLHWVICAL